MILWLPVGLWIGLALALQGSEEYTRQASTYEKQFEWEKAAAVYAQGLERYPEHPDLLRAFAGLRLRQGNLDAAQRLLESLFARQPEDAEALRMRGEIELRRGRLELAISYFQRSIQPSASNADSHFQLAQTLYYDNRIEAGVEQAARAVELSPLEPQFRILYSILLEEKGRTEESDEQLKSAHQLAPRDPQLLFALSERSRRSGRISEALEYLQSALEFNSESPLYYRRLADLYGQSGQPGQEAAALASSERLFEAFRVYISALELVRRGDIRAAAERLRSSVESNPEFVTGMTLLAHLYRRLGETQVALQWFRRILEKQPEHGHAAEQEAWLQAQEGSLSAAVELMRSRRPDSPNLLLLEAYRHMSEDRWEEALQFLRLSEAQNPLEPRLLKLISICLINLKQTAKADLYLSRLAEITPDDVEVRRQRERIQIQRAQDLFEAGRWNPAAEAFSVLIRDFDVDADYFLQRAYCYQQLGNLEAAVLDYRAGLSASPEAWWARTNLALLLQRLSRFGEAALEWEKIVDHQPSAEAFYQLGVCYFRLGRRVEADAAFRKSRLP